MADEEAFFNEGIGEAEPGVDFPISLYDRPQLGLSNLLLRGDLDAMSRSLLSPSTLSPAELKTFRSYLPRKARSNKLIKTLTDVTTNPLFLFGIILAAKFPILKMNDLLGVFNGAKGAVEAMGPSMAWVHSPFANLRNIPGMFKQLLLYWTRTTRYMYRHGKSLQDAFKTTGKMTDSEAIDAGMLQQGWNKKGIVADLHELVPTIGADASPIAPGLQGKMRAEINAFSGSLKNWFKQIRDTFGSDYPTKGSKVANELRAKNIQIGPMEKDYLPRIFGYNSYEQAGIKEVLTAKEYRTVIESQTERAVAGSLKARAGRLWPSLDELRIKAAEGKIRADVVPKMEARIAERIDGIKRWVIDYSENLTGTEPGQLKQFATDFLAKMKEPLWDNDLAGRLPGGKGAAEKTAMRVGRRIAQARGLGSEAFTRTIDDVATQFGTPGFYSLNVRTVAPKYLRALAPTWAWHFGGHGKRIMGIVDNSLDIKPWQEGYLKDNLLPLLRGLKTYKGYQQAAWWSAQKNVIHGWLKNHPMFQHLPEGTHKLLLKTFDPVGGGMGYESVLGKVSNWFYLSTLGFPNVAPAFKNTLQTWITTANMVGADGMARGLKKLVPKWGEYINLRLGGMAGEEAFAKVFPDFIKHTRDSGKLLEALKAGDMAVEGRIAPSVAKGVMDKVQAGLLLPFTTSETMLNRLLSFYATSEKALAQGMTAKKAGELGSYMMMATQFPGGILNMPKGIMNLPAPIRQFTYFPLRFFGFLHSSVRMGADPTKLHWGTIGRALMGSTAAYYGAKNLLGVDLEQGLLFGALPGPTFEGAPFFPAPFVPPVAALGGSVLQALATGEAKPLERTLPMLVPGGLGMQRLYKTFAPRYADYQNRTEDGRIPVYGANRALVGTYTPFEMFMRSVGITPTSMAGEWGAAKWLLTQREQIREYRREYLEALSQNNLTKAEKIGEEFKDRYPELGPLSVRKTDIQAVQNRHEVSRLNRIIKGFPAASRPLFEQVASQAMMQRVFEDIQAAPDSRDWYTQAIAAQQ